MLRRYQTALAWKAEVPHPRLWILMSPAGKIVNWHDGTEPPEGDKWCLIGVIE